MGKFLAALFLVSCVTTLPQHQSIEATSRRFLGLPYGTGANIVTDDLNASSYDCMTYVETVMALHLATPETKPADLLNRLRYLDGRKDEVYRKHFVESDWIPDNERLGFVTDVTRRILPDAPTLAATIDKSAWFAKVHPEMAAAFEKTLLPKQQQAELSYIPLDTVPQIIDRIPDGAIIVFIQDDAHKLQKYIHTPLLVGHMGFAIKVEGALKLRQADSNAKVIQDMDFAKAMAASKKYFRGITILEMPGTQYSP